MMTSDYAISLGLLCSLGLAAVSKRSQTADLVSGVVVAAGVGLAVGLVELILAVFYDGPPLSLVPVVFFVFAHELVVAFLLLRPLLRQQLAQLTLHIALLPLDSLDRLVYVLYHGLILLLVLESSFTGQLQVFLR